MILTTHRNPGAAQQASLLAFLKSLSCHYNKEYYNYILAILNIGVRELLAVREEEQKAMEDRIVLGDFRHFLKDFFSQHHLKEILRSRMDMLLVRLHYFSIRIFLKHDMLLAVMQSSC